MTLSLTVRQELFWATLSKSARVKPVYNIIQGFTKSEL